MNLQFWCSAQGVPWTWTWRPYLGVWLVVALLAMGAWRLYRRDGRAQGFPVTTFLGLALIWGAVDWPVGTLGAGYLASMHAVKFLVVGFIAPLLVWIDLHAPFARLLAEHPRGARVWGAITHPLPAAVLFNVVLILTHLPESVNTLSASQLGEFVNDLAWLGAGLVFYWPFVTPTRMRHKLAKIGYFFFGTLGHNALAMTLLLTKRPIYAVYELAPRVGNLSARDDQALAGTVMLLGGSFFIFTVIGRMFVNWYREEQGTDLQVVKAE